jgi:hypothetical protein
MKISLTISTIRRFGLALALIPAGLASSQDLPGRQDDTIPAQVELVYEKGLQYLAKTQNEKGAWNDSVGSEPGVVGLCVAAFLAHGEDPVNGPYAKNIRNGIDYIISQQNEKNGYIGSSMYNHAFATKALAESYGVVDNPKIAPALKKAVELILSSQETQPLQGMALHAGQPRRRHHGHRLPVGHAVRRPQCRHRGAG